MKSPCIASLLCLVSSAAAAADASFTIWSTTEKDLFPSAIISTATVDWNGDEESAEDKKSEDDPKLKKNEVALYGEENGWISAEIEGLKKGDEVEVTIAGEGYLKPSTWKGSINKNHETTISKSAIPFQGVTTSQDFFKLFKSQAVATKFKAQDELFTGAPSFLGQF